MEWLQVSVDVDAEAAEAVADVLSRFAPSGVAIELKGPAFTCPGQCQGSLSKGKGENISPERVTVKAYLSDAPDTASVQEQIERALWHMGQIYPIPAPTFSRITEVNWADAWKEHYHPLRVGQRIVIKPTWRQFETAPDDVLIELDPGMAFGTGLHPTTQLCLMALETEVHAGMQVLDLGTGSGILALAAAKLGAKEVLALDTDPTAVASAQENAQLNGVGSIVTVAQGSLAQATGAYDLVVVNILAKVIIALAREGLAERVKPGGRWVAAGIIEPQVSDVISALRGASLQVTGRRQITDWVALMGIKAHA